MGRENTDNPVKTIRRTSEPDESPEQSPRAPRWMRPGALIIEVVGSSGFPKPMSVQFHNGSASGIGFISRRPLTANTRFAVVVRHPRRGTVIFNYEVVRCQLQKRNCYDIGARLVR